MNYYEHWLGDYRKKTGRLRMAEHGAYRLLLDEYYANEEPLPEAYDELYVICRAVSRAEQETVRKIADMYFPVGADGLRHNERCDEEIAKARPKIEAARANGKHGGRPKKNPVGYLEKPSGLSTKTQRVPVEKPTRNPVVTQPETHAGEAFPHTPYPSKATEAIASDISQPPPVSVSPAKPKFGCSATSEKGARKKTALPENFCVSERVRAWAAEKGHDRLEDRLEHFLGYVRRSGARYVDWDEALMSAVREDWAKLNGRAVGKLSPAGREAATNISRWLEREEARDATAGS